MCFACRRERSVLLCSQERAWISNVFSMKPCQACNFEYDHRKSSCPQCGEGKDPTKAGLNEEESPLLEPTSPLSYLIEN